MNAWSVGLLIACGAIVCLIAARFAVDAHKRRRVQRGELVRFKGPRARAALARELGPSGGFLFRVETPEGRPLWINLPFEDEAVWLASAFKCRLRVRRQTLAEEDADREVVEGILAVVKGGRS